MVDAHEKPNDAAARQKLEEAGQRQKAALQGIAAQSPEHTEHVRRLEDAKSVDERFRATAVKAEAKADTKAAAAYQPAKPLASASAAFGVAKPGPQKAKDSLKPPGTGGRWLQGVSCFRSLQAP